MKPELEDLKMFKQAAQQTGAKERPFKGKVKDAKSRTNVLDPEWLVKNLKPSPIDKVARHREAPWYWCSPESGGKCAGCWRKHIQKECKETARSPRSAVRSTTKAKLCDTEKLKLLLLKALSVVTNEE
jgi:hypothetical protein